MFGLVYNNHHRNIINVEREKKKRVSRLEMINSVYILDMSLV